MLPIAVKHEARVPVIKCAWDSLREMSHLYISGTIISQTCQYMKISVGLVMHIGFVLLGNACTFTAVTLLMPFHL